LALTEAALRSALERIGSDAPVRFDEVTGSTQVTALELAGAGAPEWTLVAAGHQTHGRGRIDRSWLDAEGALLCSVVLRPELEAPRGGLLTLLAGAAMAEALRSTAGAEVTCTWPNDLLEGEAKIGGILAGSEVRDGRLAFVVLGVGVNLGAAPRVAGAGALAGGDAAEVLGAFLEALARDYPPTEGFAERVLERYHGVCSTLGREVRATTVDGGMVEGMAVDVDALGGLVVRSAAGLETVRFGDVEHLRPGALPG
jgi:BirA family biotin operon repressor/biotin-[acetyl-CoA-carboxylase] ligase